MLRQKELDDMRVQLEGIAEGGAELYLEGRKVSAAELAWTCCVNEEVIYMPDYVLNHEGRLTELRYDRVRLT